MSSYICLDCGGRMRTNGYYRNGTHEGDHRYKCVECGSEKHPEIRQQTDDAQTEREQKEGYTLQEEGNYALIDGYGQIHTLKGVLDYCDVDQATWMVDRHIINKWPTTAKIQDQLVSKDNWQIKAWLKRREAEYMAFPALQPIEMHATLPKPATPVDREYQRALIVPDSQNGYHKDIHTAALTPFHDRRAWDLTLQLAEQIEPDLIVLLGDMVDLPDFSDKFLKSPEFYWTFQPTLVELHWWLQQLRQIAPQAEMVYLEGNHEIRLSTSLIKHYKAAYDVKPADELDGPPAVSIERLVGLPGLDVQYQQPYDTGTQRADSSGANYWINDNLRASHGTTVRGKSGKTVTKTIEDARFSEIFGHIHRIELATKTAHPRNKIVTYQHCAAGTLAHLDGRVPSHGHKQNWQQGVLDVEYQPGNGWFKINPHYIHEGVMVYRGQELHARDRIEQLRDETEWNF